MSMFTGLEHLVRTPPPSYIYTPLDATARQIRLIRVLPGTGRCRPRCSIQIASLNDNPKFIALSYAWGTSKGRRSVNIDGRALYVTKNLYEALIQLQSEVNPSEKLLLWADAICIDQRDDCEKGHQVRMMAQIYQKACYVVIWLGKEDRSSAFTMESFQAISDSKQYKQLSLIAAIDDSKESPRIQGLKFGINCLLEKFNLFNILDAAWYTFSSREWWSRLWVIQEVALAKQAYLKCGASQISWTVFRSIMNVCDWFLEYKPQHVNKKKLWRLHDLSMAALYCSQNMQLRRGMSLLYLLRVFSLAPAFTMQRRASDHRDRIYALLGMASDAALLAVEPDYTLHWVEVYIQVAIALLRSHGPMILSYCVPAGTHQRHPNLPSWVPDWRGLICFPFHGRHASYVDTATAALRRNFTSLSISENNILSIPGAVFDYVSFVGEPPLWSPLPVFDKREHLAIVVSDFKREYERRTKDTKDATWRPSPDRYEEEALWRTPIANEIVRAGTNGPYRCTDNQDAIGYHTLLESRGQAFTSNDIRVMSYCETGWRMMKGRRLFASARGYIGIANQQIQPTDVIGILLGCDTPFILREDASGRFKFVGEAYVHGIMNGEFMDSKPKIRIFDIE